MKALLGLVPACMLFAGSAILFLRRKTVWSLAQLLGGGCLVVVVLTHISEALHLFLGCIGGSKIALVTTSIYGVPFLVSRCFPWDICFMR